MKTSTKLHLSKISIRLIIIAAIYLLFAAIFYLFKFFFRDIDLDKIADLIGILSLYAGAAITIAGILCVCLNLSLATGHKLGDIANEPTKQHIGKWLGIGILGTAVAVAAFFFIAKQTSINSRISRLKSKTAVLINSYQKNIDELPLMVSGTERLEEALELLKILSNQLSPVSDVRIIFQDTVKGIPMTVQLATWDEPDMLVSNGLGDNIYKCEDDGECDFLTSVFANNNTDTTFIRMEYGEYQYFYAFNSNEQRFVLRFTEGR